MKDLIDPAAEQAAPTPPPGLGSPAARPRKEALRDADLRRHRALVAAPGAVAPPVAAPVPGGAGQRSVLGEVVAGRGNAAPTMRREAEAFRAATGERLLPGSLNLLLSEDVFFDLSAARRTASGQRLLWRMSLCGLPVWAYRWPHAPLHVVEILAPVHLRETLGLQDGDRVSLSFPGRIAVPLTLRQKLACLLIWRGREAWSYRRDGYCTRLRQLAIDLGATQRPLRKSAPRAMLGFARRGFR
jgi:hypothetical protein